MKKYTFVKKLISKNFSDRDNSKIEYIVVHDTDNTEEGSSLEKHFNYFDNETDDSSYHYLIGNEGDNYEVYQLVEEENRAWHCGDGKGKYGITNDNSIGISICVNQDSDYVNNLINLSKFCVSLLIMHDLTMDRLVRHYDASRKVCPKSMSDNDWNLWKNFYEVTERVYNCIKDDPKGLEYILLYLYMDFKKENFSS